MKTNPLVVVAALVAGLSLAGCSGTVDSAKTAAEDKANEVVDKATDKAKDEATKAVNGATDKAKAEATKAVGKATDKAKDEASKQAKDLERKVRAELLTGGKIDPNKVSTEKMKAALNVAGIPNSDKIAKDVEKARPFTAENLDSKVKEIGKKHGVDEKKMKLVLRSLEVSK